MAFCKYCGQENSEKMKFCQNCGAKLEVSQTVEPSGSQLSAAGSVCPYCGQPVRSGAKFCKSCGAKFERTSVTEPASQHTDPPKAMGFTCPYCGKSIPSKAKFCQNCGAKLEVSQTIEPPGSRSRAVGSVCPCCGQPVHPGVQFCKNCGAKLSAPENTGEPKIIPSVVQEPSAAGLVPESALAQDFLSGKQPPVTEQKSLSPEEQKKKNLLTVIGVLGLLIVILTILSAVFIPAKIRAVQSASTPFDDEEWLEEDEDDYPPDEQPDQWIYYGGHDLPKWYYDQEG